MSDLIRSDARITWPRSILRHNDFAPAVVHVKPGETIALDRVHQCRGTKEAPLGYEMVLDEVKSIIEPYGLTTVHGDQHCADVIGQHLSKLGICLRDLPFRFAN